MTDVERWLGEHEDDGAMGGNRVLDWLCSPVIVVGLVGLLWSLPVPAVFREASPALNWGTLFLMSAVVYYFILSLSLAFGLLPFVVLVLAAVAWLDSLEIPLRIVCGTAFLAAWSLQLYGRWSAGLPLRPVTNLQHVMIAPIRLLASVYRRFGVPY